MKTLKRFQEEISPFQGHRYKLLRVFDLRPYDPDLGIRFPIDDDVKAICHRCNKKHAKVYEVLDRLTHQEVTVGGTCIKYVFAGWEPTKEELKQVEKEEKEREKKGREKYFDDYAKEVSEYLLSAEKPIPTLIEVKPASHPGFPPSEIWKDHLNKTTIRAMGYFDEERWGAMWNSYYKNLAREYIKNEFKFKSQRSEFRVEQKVTFPPIDSHKLIQSQIKTEYIRNGITK